MRDRLWRWWRRRVLCPLCDVVPWPVERFIVERLLYPDNVGLFAMPDLWQAKLAGVSDED